MYPQSHGGLAIVGIDASKGFIALWVHLFVAIEGTHRNGYRQKKFFFWFQLNSNMFNISFAMGTLPIKIGRNAQWEHLFLMYFDDFFDRLPYFLV